MWIHKGETMPHHLSMRWLAWWKMGEQWMTGARELLSDLFLLICKEHQRGWTAHLAGKPQLHSCRAPSLISLGEKLQEPAASDSEALSWNIQASEDSIWWEKVQFYHLGHVGSSKTLGLSAGLSRLNSRRHYYPVSANNEQKCQLQSQAL